MAHDDDRRSTVPEPPAASAVDAKSSMPKGGMPDAEGSTTRLEYDAGDHAADRSLAAAHGARPLGNEEADIPEDNGRRAWIDEKTGEVHGSGVGAGGGQAGEDFDDDPMTGDGPPS